MVVNDHLILFGKINFIHLFLCKLDVQLMWLKLLFFNMISFSCTCFYFLFSIMFLKWESFFFQISCIFWYFSFLFLFSHHQIRILSLSHVRALIGYSANTITTPNFPGFGSSLHTSILGLWTLALRWVCR